MRDLRLNTANSHRLDPSARQQRKPDSNRRTVLVVEDDDQVRALAGAILATAGYRVLSAATASDALGLAADGAGPIHLLLTDILLPSMTGRQLANRLLEYRPGLPVLYISGYSSEVLAERGWLEPSAFLLEKPFRIQDLLDHVEQLLASVPSD